MKQKPRKVKISVISDVHLGTYGCRSKELIRYLKSIQPEILIINGDFVDIWQFTKRYWPKSHMKVITHVLQLAAKGTRVYYLTGNHDEMLRKFEGQSVGNIKILNKLELVLDKKKAFFFHGDIFDSVMLYSKWLAKAGAFFYDGLILLNALVNQVSRLMGHKNISLSKKIKDNVKSAVMFMSNFEEMAIRLGMEKGYDYVICGHIHQPKERKVTREGSRKITYLNSGDWIENMTALEYHKKKWSIYYYVKDFELISSPLTTTGELFPDKADFDNKALFKMMLSEF
jgi:UDP-2,3-diacylglucosamine pyrophosphatase LpxH